MYGNRAKQHIINHERKRFKEEIGILDIKRKRFFTSYNIKKYESEKESDYEKGKFLPNQCYSNNLNNILITKYNMAKMLFQKKKYGESLEAYKEIFTMQKHFSSLGPSHPDTLTTMKNIAFILAEQKEYDKALKIYEEVFNIQKQIFGLYNSNTLNTRESITALLRKQRKHEKASLFFQKGQYDEALKIYEEILSFQRKFLEPYNPDIIIVRYNIAQVLSQQGKYSEALKEYEEVLSIQKNIFLDPDHPDIKQTESSIVIVQQKYECIKELDYSLRGILNSIKKLFCAKKQENCLQAKFCPKEKNNNIRSYGNEKPFLGSVPNSTLIIDNIQTTKKLLI